MRRRWWATSTFGHGVRPHLPVFGPKDGMLYVTTELDQSITIIDPKTLKIVGSIPTGQPESHMLAISHDGRRGYTANVGPGTVSVLDMTGAQDAHDDSHLRQHAADFNFERRPLGVYRRPDQAAHGGDRYGDQQGGELGRDGGAGLRQRADTGWTLAAGGVVRTQNKVAVIDLKTMKVARVDRMPAYPQESAGAARTARRHMSPA